MVHTLVQQCADARLCDTDAVLRLYDERTRAASATFFGTLPEHSAVEAHAALVDSLEVAQLSWARVLSGEDDGIPREHPGDAQRLRGSRGAGVVDDVGAEDPEHPFSRPKGLLGQRRLQKIADACAAEGLIQHFVVAGSPVDRVRIEDLRDHTNDHSWMWTTGAHSNHALQDNDEFAEAIRIRLGAGGPRA